MAQVIERLPRPASGHYLACPLSWRKDPDDECLCDLPAEAPHKPPPPPVPPGTFLREMREWRAKRRYAANADRRSHHPKGQPAEIDYDPEVVGARLRELREEIGISQRTLAELAGVSRRSVISYEQGIRANPNTLAMLQRALNQGRQSAMQALQ